MSIKRKSVQLYFEVPDETNSSTYIENIFEKTRSQIKYDTSNYNFSQSGVNDLDDLVMETGGQPLRNLVVSTWRSGSNFLGDLVTHAFPSTYYNVEPLIMYRFKQFRTPTEVNKTLSIVKQMLNCNYEGLGDYYDFVRKYLNGKWVQYNSHNSGKHRSTAIQYSQNCKNENKGDLCYNAEFTSRVCKLFPFQSVKIVHLRLKHIEEVLDDKALKLKVILLVRDPRGVMQSRLNWHRLDCLQAPGCYDPSRLCEDMLTDYIAARKILQQHPDRLIVLRFEKLALHPNTTTDRILTFLKAQRTQTFDEFLHSHTNVEVAGAYCTSRVSRNIPDKWKTALDFNTVNEIQTTCSEAMNLWGYRMAHNETHMKSNDFNPIEDYTIS